MPFEFVCPFCHQKTKVEDKYAGKSGPCASCGQPITMPSYNKNGMLERPMVTIKKKDPITLPRSRLPYIVAIACVATLLLTVGASLVLTWPYFQKRAIIAAQDRDIDNMKQIVDALNSYAAKHGTYPTPVVVDKDGVPLYSWRVLILPFLGYEDLYKEFQLDKPHDHPSNLSLLAKMPKEYASSNTDALAAQQANYVLLTGAGTLFPPSGPLTPQNTDDPTLLLIQTREGLGNWMEPGDIDVSRGVRPGPRPMRDVGGIQKDSFVSVSTKGEPLRFPNSVPANVLDSLISPNGNENVDTKPFQ
jgi:hypothetical protein